MARSQLDSARATYGPDHPDIGRLERQVAGLEKEIAATQKGGAAKPTADDADNDLRRKLEKAQAALAEAVGRYGPEHPDRIRLQREVESLQAQVAAAPVAAATPVAATRQTPQEADNPAYVQIQAQLSATLNDLASLDDQIAKLRGLETDYQKNISLAPQVEQQYRELARDYDNTRLKYQEIRSKQAEAKTAQNLEADRKGERFTLIDPPLPPEEPVSPNRKLIFIVGFLMSCGLAAGVLWLLEKLDSSVRGRNDLLNLTGVAPLALVPHIGTERERKAKRRRTQLAFGTATATAFTAVALVHFFYKPLDVLWFTFARRFGL
jgi:succinoglycan biosynthesis transport protein ExoP